MAKRKTDREMAAQIQAWRDEGLTDQQIMSEHGGDDRLSMGYRWLEQNPSVPPSEKITPAARPNRGAGSEARPLQAASPY